MSKELVPLINWKVNQPKVMSERALNVATGYSANASLFPTPPYAGSLILTKRTALDGFYANRKNGVLAKNALGTACIDMDNVLRKSADYVDGIANGVKDTINRGGFDATTDVIVHDTTVPSVGSTVEVEVVKGGYVNLTAPAIVGAKDYVFVIFKGAEFALEVTADAITVPTGSPCAVMIVEGNGMHKKLTGFVKNDEINVQVCGRNPIGYGALGPVVNTSIL